jgi:hypothetical protein
VLPGEIPPTLFRLAGGARHVIAVTVSAGPAPHSVKRDAWAAASRIVVKHAVAQKLSCRRSNCSADVSVAPLVAKMAAKEVPLAWLSTAFL